MALNIATSITLSAVSSHLKLYNVVTARMLLAAVETLGDIDPSGQTGEAWEHLDGLCKEYEDVELKNSNAKHIEPDLININTTWKTDLVNAVEMMKKTRGFRLRCAVVLLDLAWGSYVDHAMMENLFSSFFAVREKSQTLFKEAYRMLINDIPVHRLEKAGEHRLFTETLFKDFITPPQLKKTGKTKIEKLFDAILESENTESNLYYVEQSQEYEI